MKVIDMIEQQTITEQDIWQALREVPDPEIPTVNLVDLGVILRVELDEAARRARVLLHADIYRLPGDRDHARPDPRAP